MQRRRRDSNLRNLTLSTIVWWIARTPRVGVLTRHSTLKSPRQQRYYQTVPKKWSMARLNSMALCLRTTLAFSQLLKTCRFHKLSREIKCLCKKNLKRANARLLNSFPFLKPKVFRMNLSVSLDSHPKRVRHWKSSITYGPLRTMVSSHKLWSVLVSPRTICRSRHTPYSVVTIHPKSWAETKALRPSRTIQVISKHGHFSDKPCSTTVSIAQILHTRDTQLWLIPVPHS